MNANPILLQKKYVRIVELFAEKWGFLLKQHWVFLSFTAVSVDK